MLEKLIVASLIASGGHFAHNAIYLDTYPGPPWIPGPWFVVVAWCVVASVLILAYRWHRGGRPGPALAAFTAYSASCVLVFGHYLYGPPRDLSLVANGLIWAEGASGVSLIAYYTTRARHPPTETGAPHALNAPD